MAGTSAREATVSETGMTTLAGADRDIAGVDVDVSGGSEGACVSPEAETAAGIFECTDEGREGI